MEPETTTIEQLVEKTPTYGGSAVVYETSILHGGRASVPGMGGVETNVRVFAPRLELKRSFTSPGDDEVDVILRILIYTGDEKNPQLDFSIKINDGGLNATGSQRGLLRDQPDFWGDNTLNAIDIERALAKYAAMYPALDFKKIAQTIHSIVDDYFRQPVIVELQTRKAIEYAAMGNNRLRDEIFGVKSARKAA